VIEEDLDRADARDRQRAADPHRVGDPVQEVVDRPCQVPEGQPGPHIRAAFLRERGSELREQQGLRHEEHDREDHHPREGLTAALSHRRDRVHADDRADEEEEDVEAAKVTLQLLSLRRGSEGLYLEDVSHQVCSGPLVAEAHILTCADVGSVT
jgi:hypothetical protein